MLLPLLFVKSPKMWNFETLGVVAIHPCDKKVLENYSLQRPLMCLSLSACRCAQIETQASLFPSGVQCGNLIKHPANVPCGLSLPSPDIAQSMKTHQIATHSCWPLLRVLKRYPTSHGHTHVEQSLLAIMFTLLSPSILLNKLNYSLQSVILTIKLPKAEITENSKRWKIQSHPS